jgi:glutamate/tyrosine decarboxylase-like PLP-dependent enzyme
MTDRDAVLIRAARHAQAYLAGVADRRVGATATGDELRGLLAGPLPDEGEDPAAVIDRLAESARTGTVATQGPRYFGFVVGGSVPVATAADWLVSAWDQNAGLFVLSPAVSVMEDAVVGWIRDLVGLAPQWNGGFVTGGQMANFTGLASARLHVLRRAGWDVERDGLFGAPRVEVFVTEDAHYSIARSLRMLGLGEASMRPVPTDDQGRMRASNLAAMLASSTGPCIVSAQAGNVNTGAFDPVAEVADAARSRGAWLHVDGAFGLWAALSPELAPRLAGVEHADSIAVDAHKWLNVPYDCGVALCAHPEVHRAAMTLLAAYIEDSKVERDPHEFVPDESRRARSVPVYAVMRSLGRNGLRALVERGCAIARRMADGLDGHPGIEVLNDVVLNQVLVRFAPPDGGDADAFTREVITRVQNDGTCWLGGTTWKGRVAMRISVSNWSTSEADADRSVEAILRAARRPDAARHRAG